MIEKASMGFGAMVRRGGSAYLAARKFRLDQYNLGRSLRGLSSSDRIRACKDLIRSDNPLEVEESYRNLAPRDYIDGFITLCRSGMQLHWEAMKLFSRAPELTLADIMEVMPRSGKPATKEQLVSAVEQVLSEGGGMIRGVDGRLFNNPRNRDMISEQIPQVGPRGEFEILVSKHELGPYQYQLRQFVDLLVGRIVKDKMVAPEKLDELTGTETGRMIVSRHPEATAEQLAKLVCDRADFVHQAAYLNAERRGLLDAVTIPGANRWVMERLIEDPNTTLEQLKQLERSLADVLLSLLSGKISKMDPQDRLDYIMVVQEMHLWPNPELSTLIDVCRYYGIKIDTNALYFKLATRLYPKLGKEHITEELLRYLEDEAAESHVFI